MQRNLCPQGKLKRVGYLLSLIASNDVSRRVTCDYKGRKQALYCAYYKNVHVL